jgi:hypothetical protein
MSAKYCVSTHSSVNGTGTVARRRCRQQARRKVCKQNTDGMDNGAGNASMEMEAKVGMIGHIGIT